MDPVRLAPSDRISGHAELTTRHPSDHEPGPQRPRTAPRPRPRTTRAQSDRHSPTSCRVRHCASLPRTRPRLASGPDLAPAQAGRVGPGSRVSPTASQSRRIDRSASRGGLDVGSGPIGPVGPDLRPRGAAVGCHSPLLRGHARDRLVEASLERRRGARPDKSRFDDPSTDAGGSARSEATLGLPRVRIARARASGEPSLGLRSRYSHRHRRIAVAGAARCARLIPVVRARELRGATRRGWRQATRSSRTDCRSRRRGRRRHARGARRRQCVR